MDITEMLRRGGHGDDGAVQQVFPLLYSELKRLAAGHLRGQWNVTMSATALVHEAFLRVADLDSPKFEDRAHFFGIASRIMRNVLVDLVRQRNAEKRGPGLTIQLDDVADLQDPRANDLLVLDQAMTRLSGEHPREARALEMRYFAGMTSEEIAANMNISETTVKRDLRFAQAWLRREIAAGST